MMVPILMPEHRWVCLSCDLQEVTHEPRPHSRMHPCAGLKGLTAPMVPEGTRGKQTLNDREDYEGTDLAPRDDDGRVVMSLTTEREDGIDCTVYASTATATGEVA